MVPQSLWSTKGLRWLSWVLFNPCIIASLHFYYPIQNKSCWLFADPCDCEIRDSRLQHQEIGKQQCKTHHWNKVMVRDFWNHSYHHLCSIIKYSFTLTPSFFLLLPLLPPRKRKQAVRTANPGTSRIPKIIKSMLTSSLSSKILTSSWGRLKWQTFLNKLHFNQYKFHFLLSNYIHQLGSCSIIRARFTFTRPIDVLQ